jgi:hypothetical protein
MTTVLICLRLLQGYVICYLHDNSLHLFVETVSFEIFMTITLICLSRDYAICFQTEDILCRDIFSLREGVNSRFRSSPLSSSAPPPDLFPVAPFGSWFYYDSVLAFSLLGELLLTSQNHHNVATVASSAQPSSLFTIPTNFRTQI